MPMTPDLVFEAAHRLGVRVEWADLGDRSGLYDDDRRTITLDPCLTERQAASTGAHELSHATWRDRPTRDRRLHQRRERRADGEAARTLVAPEEYARAEAIVGPDPAMLADELDVEPWVIEAWQREAEHGRGWTCTAKRWSAA